MSGVVFVRPDVSWISPGWIYDNCLERIAAELQSADSLLAELLSNSVTTMGGVCDLTRVGTASFRQLILATLRVHDWYVQRGVLGFTRDGAYTAVMLDLADLRLMLRSDARSGESSLKTSAILLDERMTWMVEGWALDRVIEQVDAVIHRDKPFLASILLASRNCVGCGSIDLTHAEADDFCVFMQTISLLCRYVGQKRRKFIEDPVYQVIDTYYDQLMPILMADPRARNCVTEDNEAR